MIFKKQNVLAVIAVIVLVLMLASCPRPEQNLNDDTDLSLVKVEAVGSGSNVSGKAEYFPEGWVNNGTVYESYPLILKKGNPSILPMVADVYIAPKDENVKVELSSPVSVTYGEVIKEGKKENGGHLTYVISIHLRDYENIVNVKLRSVSGKKEKKYTVKIIRDAVKEEGAEAPFWLFIDDSPSPESFNFKEGTSKYVIKTYPSPSTLKLKIKTKIPSSLVSIGGDFARTVEKTFNLSSEKFTSIKLRDRNGKETSYTVTFSFAKKDCSLKSLKIAGYDHFDFDPNVFEYFNIPLSKGNITFNAVPNSGKAKVEIDGKPVDSDFNSVVNLTSLPKTVIVKVINEEQSIEYKLNIIEACTESETAKIDILVVDSIGGTKVHGTKLNVFETGSTTPAVPEGTVTNGLVSVDLVPNKYYDFELIGEKGKWAGSKLTNYYIDARTNQALTLYQYVHGQIGRNVLPPKVLSIKGNGKTIINGSSIDKSFKSLTVEFLSPSAAIREMDGGGFGAKLGLGLMPSSLSGITGVDEDDIIYTISGWQQKIGFKIDPKNINIPRGKTDLILVAYDAANNRLEHHVYVDFNQELQGKSLEFAEFSDLIMLTKRSPFSANTYSYGKNSPKILALNPVGDKHTSYSAMLQFKIKEKDNFVSISGFDIYRREAESTLPFKRVSRRLYGELRTNSASDSYDHIGWDTDSTLEENVLYEYKIVALMDMTVKNLLYLKEWCLNLLKII